MSGGDDVRDERDRRLAEVSPAAVLLVPTPGYVGLLHRWMMTPAAAGSGGLSVGYDGTPSAARDEVTGQLRTTAEVQMHVTGQGLGDAETFSRCPGDERGIVGLPAKFRMVVDVAASTNVATEWAAERGDLGVAHLERRG
jgi:hypothetical protein